MYLNKISEKRNIINTENNETVWKGMPKKKFWTDEGIKK